MLAQQNLILPLEWQNMPEHQATSALHAFGSACSSHFVSITGSSATVASNPGDVKLSCRVAFGEVNKDACWSPGLTPVITENKATPVSGEEKVTEDCLAGERDRNFAVSLLSS